MKKKIIYVACDGSEHETEIKCVERDAKLKGRTFKCPACDSGKQRGEPITEDVYDEESTAWGGQFASPVYKTVIVGYTEINCVVCNGHGWTTKQKTPVVESKIVGWENKQT